MARGFCQEPSACHRHAEGGKEADQAWLLQDELHGITANVGASIIRIGFWGPLYYNYNKEPPKPYSND